MSPLATLTLALGRQPRALDLFCCAGGATRGLVDAGFEVHGIDLDASVRDEYLRSGAKSFTHGSALAGDLDYLRSFDLIWASPPCQLFTAYKRRPGHVVDRLNFIPATRELLAASGVPYIIENVEGARSELRNPTRLCGSMFGLDVRRHRMFETSWDIPKDERPQCNHKVWAPNRFPGATNRAPMSRSTAEIGVWRIPLPVQCKAMGIHWMSLERLSQAIPPAFSSWLGNSALAHIDATRTGHEAATRTA